MRTTLKTALAVALLALAAAPANARAPAGQPPRAARASAWSRLRSFLRPEHPGRAVRSPADPTTGRTNAVASKPWLRPAR